MNLFGEEEIKTEETVPVFNAEQGGGVADYPHAPNTAKVLFGHDDVEKKLLSMIKNDRLPHALIFVGERGIGKATMAFRLAKYIFSSQRPDEDSLDVSFDDQAYGLVASMGHTDLRHITVSEDRASDTLGVKEIRSIESFMHLTAFFGGWKIVIVDEAEKMTLQAQNALLKTLEEPTGKTLLILVCNNSGALLPTIRSRVQAIKFGSLARDDYLKVMALIDASLESDCNKADIVEVISGGSPGNALLYLESGIYEYLEKFIDILNDFPDFDWVKVHKLADMFALADTSRSLYSLCRVIIREIHKIAICKAKSPEKIIEKDSVFANSLGNCSLEFIIGICDSLEQHFKTAEYSNLDRRQVIIGAFVILKNGKKN